MVALVTTPLSLEETAIRPGHRPEAVALTRIEPALVLCFFDLVGLCIVAQWQAVVVLECAIAIGSSILEAAKEPVTILVDHLGLPVETAVQERASPHVLLIDARDSHRPRGVLAYV